MPSPDAYREEHLCEHSEEELSRIIEMAWEDRTPFEAIRTQWGISEPEVVQIMKRELRKGSYVLWRERVSSGTSRKHAKRRLSTISRFRSAAQRAYPQNNHKKKNK